MAVNVAVRTQHAGRFDASRIAFCAWMWCRSRDSNPDAPCGAAEFKSAASAGSATSAIRQRSLSLAGGSADNGRDVIVIMEPRPDFVAISPDRPDSVAISPNDDMERSGHQVVAWDTAIAGDPPGLVCGAAGFMRRGAFAGHRSSAVCLRTITPADRREDEGLSERGGRRQEDTYAREPGCSLDADGRGYGGDDRIRTGE